MPEGPTIVLLKEEVSSFTGKTIIAVAGTTTIDKDQLVNKKIIAFKTWGKHFLICCKGFSIRIHLLMFGIYRINEKKDGLARLSLVFKKGEINFYTCNIKYLEGNINTHYDFTADVMNDKWDPQKALLKLKTVPDERICDVLLDQEIFSGVGNIIKNEILYRVRIHPESSVGKIPRAKLKKLVDETRIYSFQFLEWKRMNELKKHWLAYSKKICPRCDIPLIKKYTGKKKRRSFFCNNCQTLYK